MRADASNAPAGGLLSRFEALLTARTEIAGHAKMLAAPAYRQLLRSEKALRRSIPILIVSFLALAAVIRLATLVEERMALEEGAVRDLRAAFQRAEVAAGEVEDLDDVLEDLKRIASNKVA